MEKIKLNGANPLLCSFELCKLLKEKGVDISCDYWYFDDVNGVEFHRFNTKQFMSNDCELAKDVYPCPNLLDLLSWFIKNRSVTVTVTMGIYSWGDEEERYLHWDYDVVELSDERLDYPCDVSYGYKTMEDALESGLKFLLEKYA